MSYELRDQQEKRDQEYQSLKSRRTQIELLVSNWIDTATSLFDDSPLQTDKDDLLAQRTDMIAALKVTLGL
jgi:hypothetical protein